MYRQGVPPLQDPGLTDAPRGTHTTDLRASPSPGLDLGRNMGGTHAFQGLSTK